MEKQSGRWKLVSPSGNNFCLLSVFNANEDFIETGIMQQRYNNDAELWAMHRGERMLSWGFNTLGEYTGTRGLPVGTWGGKSSNPVKLPFIFFMDTADLAIYHPSDIGLDEPIKQIINGIPSSTYNCAHNYCGVGCWTFSIQSGRRPTPVILCCKITPSQAASAPCRGLSVSPPRTLTFSGRSKGLAAAQLHIRTRRGLSRSRIFSRPALRTRSCTPSMRGGVISSKSMEPSQN